MSTLKWILSWFGIWGWLELNGALLVAVGCIGELWILLNKLTRHVEDVGKTAGMIWKCLIWSDRQIRPLLVRLKIRGRKISEVKEQLLERLFVTLVAFGVGMELIAIPFSLRESARFNNQAGIARRLAGQANERAGVANKLAADANLLSKQLEATNLVLRSNMVALEHKLYPRIITDIQHSNFVAALKGAPQKPVWVVCAGASSETRILALKVRQMLDEAGYAADLDPPEGVYGSGGKGIVETTGSVINAEENPDLFAVVAISREDALSGRIPPHAMSLARAFSVAGIRVRNDPVDFIKSGVVLVGIPSKKGL